MKRPKADKHAHAHEPIAEGDDWVDVGGQRTLAAGFTAGGFPYGTSEEELRRCSAEDDRQAGWARAKRLLEVGARQRAGPAATVDVGYVKKMGQGLSRDVFAAAVEISTRSTREEVDLAALLPRRGSGDDIDVRTRNEANILAGLATIDLPFRVPRLYGVLPDGSHLALIRTFERGVELDPRAGRQPGVRPWEVVAEIAAAIHELTSDRCPWLDPEPATRRDHAGTALDPLADLDLPEAADARAWIGEHLPPPTPSVLLHGDLLGKNILLGVGDPNAVIDWEYGGLGDPAYDIAIVTRGGRQPFQLSDGLERLLEAYAEAGGAEVTRAHVHVHELGLAARWYRDGPSEHERTQSMHLLRSILRRATRAK